jgi:hypothetical protein
MQCAVKIQGGSTESRLLQELAFKFDYRWAYCGREIKNYGPYLIFHKNEKVITWWHDPNMATAVLSIEDMIRFIKGEYVPSKTFYIAGQRIEIVPNTSICIGNLTLSDKDIQSIMTIYKD